MDNVCVSKRSRLSFWGGRETVLSSKPLIFGLQSFVLLAFSAGCFSPVPADHQLSEAGAEAARCKTPEDSERMADQVLELVNLERAQQDLQPVVVNPALTKIAADYSCRLVTGKFFAHQDPESGYGPGERAIAGRYTFYAIGENLAAGQESPAEVMKVWMESTSHRRIILDPSWKEVGIAVRFGGEYGTYWVQEFADPADF